MMTHPDVRSWAREDEFLLATTYPLPPLEELSTFLTELRDIGVAGMGVKVNDKEQEQILSALEDEYTPDIPVITIPGDVRFHEILNEVFRSIINRQGAALAQANDIHQTLLTVTLQGGGLEKLCREVATILSDAAVYITDEAGLILAHAGNTLHLSNDIYVDDGVGIEPSRLIVGIHEDESGYRWAGASIRAGQSHYGHLIAIENKHRFDEVALTAVEQAAIVAAVEFTQQDAISAIQNRFTSNALHSLLLGTKNDMGSAFDVAHQFEWNIERQVRVVVCAPQRNESVESESSFKSRILDRLVSVWNKLIKQYDLGSAA